MGVRNYLIEGVSGTGKTAIADELLRRGYQAIHGDRELAYQGDPASGRPLASGARPSHQHHIWDVARVKALAAEQDSPVTFFCGGSRNFSQFLDVFDAVFVLTVDRATLLRRLGQRGADEFGAGPAERRLILQLHSTQQDVPRNGLRIDAAAPVEVVADRILRAADRPGTAR